MVVGVDRGAAVQAKMVLLVIEARVVSFMFVQEVDSDVLLSEQSVISGSCVYVSCLI